LALFVGGIGVAYAGYQFEQNHRILARLSYVIGGGFIVAAVILAFLTIDELVKETAGPPEAVSQSSAAPGSQPTRAPSAAIAPTAKEPSQLATQFTAESFAKAVHERTDIQAKALYLNRRITLSGSVDNVFLYGNTEPVVAFWVDFRAGHESIWMRFSSDWKDRALTLKRGDKVTVSGKLVRIEPGILNLTDCELLSVP